MSNNHFHNINGSAPISELTIREATAADAPAISHLAELDTSRIPAGPMVVAESGGELLAAMSIADGQAVADPFRPTAELVAILRMQAGVEPADRGALGRISALFGSRPVARPRPSTPSVPGFPVVPGHTH
jgi:hypothetical protein